MPPAVSEIAALAQTISREAVKVAEDTARPRKAAYAMARTVQNGQIAHSRGYTDTAAAVERLKAWSPAGSTAG